MPIKNISVPTAKESRLFTVAAKVWARREGIPLGAAFSRFARAAMREKIQKDGLLQRQKEGAK